MQELGLRVSINLGSRQVVAGGVTLGGGGVTGKLQAIQVDFSSSKSQFLFTVSEPSVCQNTTSSCVFHLDVPAEMLSIYAVRLLVAKAKASHGHDVVSVLFTEKASKVVPELSKMFSVSFLDMPFEFIPMM
eukprot:g12763.t1